MFPRTRLIPDWLQLTDWLARRPAVVCITNHPTDPRCPGANRIVMVITLGRVESRPPCSGPHRSFRVTKSDYTSANSGYFEPGNVASLAPLVIGFTGRNDKKWPTLCIPFRSFGMEGALLE